VKEEEATKMREVPLVKFEQTGVNKEEKGT